MTPGDIPCERPCRNILCRYCAFGMCMDNAVCEKQMDAELNLTHAQARQPLSDLNKPTK